VESAHDAQRDWVVNGSPNWTGKWNHQWYGIKRFFGYLESKAYKMHIRVLLSKYRSYTPCPVCAGARLKTEALLWRLGTQADADAALPAPKRFMPQGVAWTRAQLEALPGLTVHDLMLMPIERIRRFFDAGRAAEHLARRRAEAAARRDPHAPEVPLRRRHRLPDAWIARAAPCRAARSSAST
jgi:excinuclease UvrABC ATPase subunit